MSINFQESKRGELAELEFELNHNKLERRVEAIKKVFCFQYNFIGYCCYDCGQERLRFILPSIEMCGD